MYNRAIKKEKEYNYYYNFKINSKIESIFLERDKKKNLFRLKISNYKNKLLYRVNEIEIKKGFLDLLNYIPQCSANKEPKMTNQNAIFCILSLVIFGSGLFYCSKKLGRKFLIKKEVK